MVQVGFLVEVKFLVAVSFLLVPCGGHTCPNGAASFHCGHFRPQLDQSLRPLVAWVVVQRHQYLDHRLLAWARLEGDRQGRLYRRDRIPGSGREGTTAFLLGNPRGLYVKAARENPGV